MSVRDKWRGADLNLKSYFMCRLNLLIELFGIPFASPIMLWNNDRYAQANGRSVM